MNENEIRKAELINALLDYRAQVEDIFKYHPSNPNKIDIEIEYTRLMGVCGELERVIQSLNH
jgi:hypothetical protein